MYCINCGVKLADAEKECPLCGIKVYHPDILQAAGENIYPKGKYPQKEAHPLGPAIFMTAIFLLPMFMTLACDIRFNKSVSWSGFVVGALLVGYIILILPLWFRMPHPIIFVPCYFAAIGLYIWYINWATSGDWFLTFALPIVGCVGVIVTTVVVLLQCLKRGRLYIFGGAFIAMGALMLLIEFLLGITFAQVNFIGWSFYPLASLVLVGGLLIFLGICRPAREAAERKFFV